MFTNWNWLWSKSCSKSKVTNHGLIPQRSHDGGHVYGAFGNPLLASWSLPASRAIQGSGWSASSWLRSTYQSTGTKVQQHVQILPTDFPYTLVGSSEFQDWRSTWKSAVRRRLLDTMLFTFGCWWTHLHLCLLTFHLLNKFLLQFYRHLILKALPLGHLSLSPKSQTTNHHIFGARTCTAFLLKSISPIFLADLNLIWPP